VIAVWIAAWLLTFLTGVLLGLAVERTARKDEWQRRNDVLLCNRYHPNAARNAGRKRLR
jgi:hypothetical protein